MSTQKRKVKNEEKSDLEKKTSNKNVPKLKNLYAKTIFFLFFFLGTLTFKVRLWEKHSNLFKTENRCCA